MDEYRREIEKLKSGYKSPNTPKGEKTRSNRDIKIGGLVAITLFLSSFAFSDLTVSCVLMYAGIFIGFFFLVIRPLQKKYGAGTYEIDKDADDVTDGMLGIDPGSTFYIDYRRRHHYD